MNENKDYLAFLDMVANCVNDVYQGEVIAERCISMKNNGVQVIGIMLRKKGKQVAPNFYIEQHYQEWVQGTKSLHDIVNNLCHVFESELETSQHLAETICFQWESIRQNTFLRLVNRDKNKELLNDIPYMEFMDLAIVYFYSLNISNEVQGTLILTEQHQKLLGITKEELHQVAEENTRKLRPIKVYQMGDLIAHVSKTLGIEVLEPVIEQNFMYILSNESGMFGAISMFFQDELKKLATQLECSFYILPSSIHEVIVVPDYQILSPEKYLEIVRDINATQLQETEILSDSIYYYDKAIEQLRRVG